MSEKRIVTKILKVLREQGGWWIKTHGGSYQESGLPDIIGSLRGRFVSFEVKKPGEEASEIQKYVMKQIREEGEGVATIITSPEEALEVLDGWREFRV